MLLLPVDLCAVCSRHYNSTSRYVGKDEEQGIRTGTGGTDDAAVGCVCIRILLHSVLLYDIIRIRTIDIHTTRYAQPKSTADANIILVVRLGVSDHNNSTSSQPYTTSSIIVGDNTHEVY